MFFRPCIVVLKLLLTALSAFYTNASATGTRTLVLLDATLDPTVFSSYFAALEKQGLDLIYRTTKEAVPTLTAHGEKAFDHLLLFAPEAKTLAADLTPQALVEFLKNDGNILFALSPSIAEQYRDLAREFDLEFDERGSRVVDHFRSLASDPTHTSILIENAADNTKWSPVLSASSEAFYSPFLYKNGILHRIGDNPLAFSVVRPGHLSYSFEGPSSQDTEAEPLDRLDSSDREVMLGSDQDVSLISAFQLLNTDRRNPDQSPKRTGSSGRAAFVGSIDAFSNAAVDAKGIQANDGKSYSRTSNLAILSSLTSWVTQNHGVIHVAGTSHERVRQNAKDVRETYEEFATHEDNQEIRVQNMYRIMDTVTFNIDLLQHTQDAWAPAPNDLDLQVSLVMLDPFVTTNLTARKQPINLVPSSSNVAKVELDTTPRLTRYSSTFRLPDKHGVYTFVVDWKRHGWSYISTRDTTPVRPLNSDEHPRFLHAAYPYVSGAASTAVAFLLFSLIWITSDDRSGESLKKGELNK